MKLELFDFIDQTVTLFKANTRIYQYAVIHLEQLFTDIFATAGDNFVSLHSRVKSPVSLKEKLIRNRFYLMYQNPREAIEHLSDLIGITVGCRFISNEKQMYDLLHVFFEPSQDDF
ncbi:MAG: RelA/spoT family protein, partial [Solobacterium sp.]|nr:RelA/spoT family protein [Solobacterium sp.]